MEVKYVEQQHIRGFSTITNNEAEMTPGKGKIPALWQKFDNTIPVNYQGGERVYGVYSDYESDHTGHFRVLAGFDGSLDDKTLSEGVKVETVTIPSGKYLVFSHKGEMPQIAIDTWASVWQYFTEGKPEHTRTFGVDFEHYPNANQIDVYISVT
ncbi:GyrI-like domain-containing protein [Alteromonas sp. S167]|uniref:GyrI-like domain-containing protein n=1 Tax=Alteromonas sp. S167 TaxID=3117402 RepID=UPI002FE3927A